MGGRCFDRATGHNERLLAQDAQDLGRLEAANAMGFQQARDAAFAQADGLGGCRRQYPQIEQPIGLCQSNGRVVRAWRSTPRPKRPLGRESAPLGQCAGSSLFVDLASDEMALLIEVVVDLGVN